MPIQLLNVLIMCHVLLSTLHKWMFVNYAYVLNTNNYTVCLITTTFNFNIESGIKNHILITV